MSEEENLPGENEGTGGGTQLEEQGSTGNSFSGVFPVHELGVKIANNGRTTPSTFVTIADMESASIAVETGVEQWKPLDQSGWSRAFVTGKSFKVSFSGKRNIGDQGNNYIASKTLATGADCNSVLQIVFPDGWTITVNVVISVSECGTGESTNVGPLKFDLISDGKPTTSFATT